MKKIKFTAVFLIAAILSTLFLSSAFAIDAAGEALGALGEYFGISGTTAASGGNEDPDANDDITNSAGGQVNIDSSLSDIGSGLVGAIVGGAEELYSSISGITDGSDFNSLLSGGMDKINELLGGIMSSNTPTSPQGGSDTPQGGNNTPATHPYTVPQYTNIYVTEAPQVTYNYSGSTGTTSSYTPPTVVAEATTAPESTTSPYTPPSQIYGEEYTTTPFNYDVADADAAAQAEDGVTLKTIVGIVILVISGVAVVGVALTLKKSKV